MPRPFQPGWRHPVSSQDVNPQEDKCVLSILSFTSFDEALGGTLFHKRIVPFSWPASLCSCHLRHATNLSHSLLISGRGPLAKGCPHLNCLHSLTVVVFLCTIGRFSIFVIGMSGTNIVVDIHKAWQIFFSCSPSDRQTIYHTDFVLGY